MIFRILSARTGWHKSKLIPRVLCILRRYSCLSDPIFVNLPTRSALLTGLHPERAEVAKSSTSGGGLKDMLYNVISPKHAMTRYIQFAFNLLNGFRDNSYHVLLLHDLTLRCFPYPAAEVYEISDWEFFYHELQYTL